MSIDSTNQDTTNYYMGPDGQTLQPDHKDIESTVQFTPPLWSQRIDKVRQIIFSHNTQEICDLGCGQGQLLGDLRMVFCITKLIGMDINYYQLQRAQDLLGPFPGDRMNGRVKELSIKLIKGSALKPTQIIPRQIQCVTCCQVIEHIWQVDQLTHNIFYWINPKMAIVTTPNRDFNKYFENPEKLRHYDHKFEFTQQEFEEWAWEACQKYGYRVEFTGVGKYKDYPQFCTQIAVFHRLQMKFLEEEAEDGGHSVVFQYLANPKEYKSFEFEFVNCVLYAYSQAICRKYLEYGDQIKLKALLKSVRLQSLCDNSVYQLRYLLEKYFTCQFHPGASYNSYTQTVRVEPQVEEENFDESFDENFDSDESFNENFD